MARLSLLAVAALSLASTASAQAQAVQVGTLECRGGASVGFIIGSVTNLRCVLRGANVPDDFYVATINKIGLDIGITEETSLVWTVFSTVARPGRGDLSGSYSGVQGSASFGPGLGANLLVGGSNNTVALQPASVQGQVGLSIAAGLETLRLAPGR